MLGSTRFFNIAAGTLALCFSSLAISSGAPELAEVDPAKLSYSFEKDLPNLSPAYIESSPLGRGDGIEVADLSSHTNASSDILAFAKEAAASRFGEYDSLLIAHKNKLVFESYFRKGRVNLPHFQASVTKSHTALAVGRAIQLGYLSMDDLDKPIVHLLKGLDKSKLAKGVEHITLRKAMTMSSGLRVEEEKLRQLTRSARETKGSDIVQQLLEATAAISPESQSFLYQGVDLSIVMQVLEEVVPGSSMSFIDKELLSKLGISVYRWRTDANGVAIGASGSSITSRDMLKLGSLVLNDGQWKGEQLISKAFLEEATRKLTQPTDDWIPDNYYYGFYWYPTDFTVNGKQITVDMAWGGGDQRIIVFKELDLIVVVTGATQEGTIMDQIAQVIFPAFDK